MKFKLDENLPASAVILTGGGRALFRKHGFAPQTAGGWPEVTGSRRAPMTDASSPSAPGSGSPSRTTVIVTAKPFTVRITARGYEVDSNGHVAGTVLLQYGHHALGILAAAGVDQADLAAKGLGQ